MGAYGFLLVLLSSYGSLWVLMGFGLHGSWSSWDLAAPFWSFRVVMGSYGSLWMLMGAYRFL